MTKYQSFHLNNTERKSNLLRGCNLKERPCHCCTKTKRLTTDRNLPWRYIEKSEKENKLGVRLAMESPVNWWRKERMKRLLLLLCSSPLPLIPGERGKKTLAFKSSFPMGLRSEVVGLGLRLRGPGCLCFLLFSFVFFFLLFIHYYIPIEFINDE